MSEYFAILTGIFILTVFLHKKSKVKLYKSTNHFLTFNFINITLATIWDQFAISRGH